ncbi:MAG TPA: glycosyltransferase [Methylovirgula sp.]|nr:glycosyltransferase [Methylovirgula sp.]
MKLLHVVPTYLPAVRYGGPIFAVHGLCRALVERGHQVEVYTTSVNGAEDSDVPIGIPVTIDGVVVRYFQSKLLRRLFWAPPLAKALDLELSTFSLAHLHSVFLWPTAATAALARRARVPYVLSPRGMLVKDLIERRSRYAKSAWIELFEKRNLQRAAAIHVTSEVEAQELRRFGWSLPPIEVISNGVEALSASYDGSVSPDVRDAAAGHPLLFLGRLSWKKGLDRLLRALALTWEPKLAIVGTDDEAITPQLQQMAAELGVAHRVRFLSRTVLGADKEYLYASARAFVLPSYSENFGNTVLEAMQRGLPIITTPEVGASQIVLDAKAGLVTDGDADSLSGAIQNLWSSDTMARTMGEAGRHHVGQHFGWPTIAAEMEALYETLIATSRQRLSA